MHTYTCNSYVDKTRIHRIIERFSRIETKTKKKIMYVKSNQKTFQIQKSLIYIKTSEFDANFLKRIV